MITSWVQVFGLLVLISIVAAASMSENHQTKVERLMWANLFLLAFIADRLLEISQ